MKSRLGRGAVISGSPVPCSGCRKSFTPSNVHSRKRSSGQGLCPLCCAAEKKKKAAKKQR